MSEKQFRFEKDLAEINQKLDEVIHGLRRINETLYMLKGEMQDLKLTYMSR